MVRWGKTLLAVVLVSMTSVAAFAQTADKPPAQTSQPAQASQPAAAATQPADQLLKPEQLEALVAPIALYPDSLLANVLAASTYPLEVVQADRWLKERKSLKGDALKTEVDKQAWDDSVKALASTADVLAMMSDKIDWTKNLGDAVLAQQPDVMDAIQRLRSKAQANNKLVTTKQQKVSVQTQENKQVIVIEQTDPNTVYVPYYDPATVYGAWPYAAYPPYYFGYPSYIGAGVVAAGLAFGAGWAIGRWGNYWGGGFNWGNRNVYVNHRTTNIANGWQHNSAHRQGVRYNNSNVQQRFGGNNNRAGVSDRMNYRGRDGQQVLNPGGDRQGADRAGDRGGDRAGDRAGDRGGDRAGDRGRGGDRAGAGDRAKGGDRAGAGNRAKGGGDRAKAANRGSAGNRAAAANRGGGNRGGAMNVSSGRAAAAASARGRSSMASMPRGGGASFAGRGGGGGFRGGGGGGGFRGGGGGRRSDIALKHDIELLGYVANGLGYYRFSYLGSSKAYVGVMAQEVEQVMPTAVTRGTDGYLRVYYDKLGIKFRSYHDWLAAGARIPFPSEASR
ncbi:DUF3300 domain-containing protein [Bradyrhizobium sp. NAS96.2]|uniref:DUF3300 domain-containing protein n=1 Tax=Bradyrhizobium sp. NAS96.2 TaxID=1680160 RepID=UPI00093DC588|nr:DUF3300 domain-containing protein [Bradyrhizobium sp. NAS96.2]OKO83561.1 hypothetical protein AC628_01570 [Bradyrhizobium sp. NAS96.2]